MFRRILKYPYAPWWVCLVYAVLEWADYRLLSPVSRRLTWWRNGLLDRYCECPKCLERQKQAEERRRSLPPVI